MIIRIVAMKVCGPHRLDLTFNDGTHKRVDVSPLLDGPVFEPLKSAKFFAKARLDAECGAVVWPNGADFAPETLLDLLDASGRTRPKTSGKGKAILRTRG